MSTLRRRAEPRRAPAARRAVRGPAGCAPVSSGHAPGSVREAHSPGAGGQRGRGPARPRCWAAGRWLLAVPRTAGSREGSEVPAILPRALIWSGGRPPRARSAPGYLLTPRFQTPSRRGAGRPRVDCGALASASGAFLREPRSNPDPVRCRPALGVTSLSARAPSLHEGVSSPLRRLCLPSSPPVSPAPGRCPAHSRC